MALQGLLQPSQRAKTDLHQRFSCLAVKNYPNENPVPLAGPDERPATQASIREPTSRQDQLSSVAPISTDPRSETASVKKAEGPTTAARHLDWQLKRISHTGEERETRRTRSR
ncbi:hypothetical protein H109_06700 [Trichophyton interdigitale MR816]|uniref:Uncharacterized protein n=1 Tax=Trichophyton interdigitale (strain MR816) TaxID=1215338 RepID=A0A059J0S0_TRIIM|nr:hypothetical protein H109_06700 [Trichophyton interdigitale MR816]